MVLSIISAVLCIFLLGLAAGGLGYDDNYYDDYSRYDDSQYYNGMFFTRGSSSKSSRVRIEYLPWLLYVQIYIQFL